MTKKRVLRNICSIVVLSMAALASIATLSEASQIAIQNAVGKDSTWRNRQL
jgi:hypothetical protein